MSSVQVWGGGRCRGNACQGRFNQTFFLLFQICRCSLKETQIKTPKNTQR